MCVGTTLGHKARVYKDEALEVTKDIFLGKQADVLGTASQNKNINLT